MFAVLPDPGIVFPAGGIAALLVIMLRMLISDNASRRLIEGKLRKEWATEKAALVKYNDDALARAEINCTAMIDMRDKLHVDELASQNRRIDALEAEVVSLRGRT